MRLQVQNYYVYIITNNSKTLYIGMTNNLQRRMYEHINEVNKGFSKKYKLKKLVYYEIVNSAKEAIKREKQLKNWHRQWKINLIEEKNPNWEDLMDTIHSLDAETSSA